MGEANDGGKEVCVPGGASARERIFSCALQEFLHKGFADASLRRIAAAAAVTTGAIYGYVSGKEALFDAIVAPAGDELYRRYETFQEDFYALPPERQLFDQMQDYERDAIHRLLDYVYDHHDAFMLILLRSAGTSWERYPERFAALEERSAHRYARTMSEKGFPIMQLAPATARILAAMFMRGYFEPLVSGMPRQQAHAFIEDYRRFFHAGYVELMVPEGNAD